MDLIQTIPLYGLGRPQQTTSGRNIPNCRVVYTGGRASLQARADNATGGALVAGQPYRLVWAALSGEPELQILAPLTQGDAVICVAEAATADTVEDWVTIAGYTTADVIDSVAVTDQIGVVTAATTFRASTVAADICGRMMAAGAAGRIGIILYGRVFNLPAT